MSTLFIIIMSVLYTCFFENARDLIPNERITMQDINYGKIVIKLDDIMKSQNVSINKLAFRAEMQRTQLKAYIRNEIQRVDLDILARLCHALDCDITDILEYEKPRQ